MNITTLVENLRTHFNTGLTKTLSYRQKQLSGIERFLRECEKEIEKALHQDLGRSILESYLLELTIVISELQVTKKNLATWMKPQRVSTNLVMQPGKSRIYSEPRGVVLIISPWNYPIQLTLVPLIGALAAGNCVVIKPSEVAPATSRLLATYLPKYIDHECLQIIEGGVPETTTLLTQPFDYIFYTGNTKVGKIVMEAAAKQLTPITLELGGKSPCIVDQNANLDIAARRIIWGKFSNAGQTCVAPDYVLAHETIKEALLDRMQHVLHEFYGKNPKNSPDYGRIINAHHHQRLMNLLSGSGDIYIGGEADANDNYIAPTLLHRVLSNAPVMEDEIFGPILPILEIKNIEMAIEFINKRPKPLAIYLFSSSDSIQEKVITNTSSGGVCINHTMVHLAVPTLPFGGVGASGMGAYHGKSTFETFSHCKSVFWKPTWFDLTLIYPPYKTKLKKILNWLI